MVLGEGRGGGAPKIWDASWFMSHVPWFTDIQINVIPHEFIIWRKLQMSLYFCIISFSGVYTILEVACQIMCTIFQRNHLYIGIILILTIIFPPPACCSPTLSSIHQCKNNTNRHGAWEVAALPFTIPVRKVRPTLTWNASTMRIGSKSMPHVTSRLARSYYIPTFHWSGVLAFKSWMRLFMPMIVSTRRRSNCNVCDTEYLICETEYSFQGGSIYLEVYFNWCCRGLFVLMQHNPHVMVNLMTVCEA